MIAERISAITQGYEIRIVLYRSTSIHIIFFPLRNRVEEIALYDKCFQGSISIGCCCNDTMSLFEARPIIFDKERAFQRTMKAKRKGNQKSRLYRFVMIEDKRKSCRLESM